MAEKDMIDLHTHSSASDGSFSPAALVAYAAKRGISALALTDHDTTEGLAEAARAAAEHQIRFIPGIEIDIAWKEMGEFHLLGLGINAPSRDFLAAIEELRRRRKERNLEMLDLMNKAGISATYDDISALAGGTEPEGEMVDADGARLEREGSGVQSDKESFSGRSGAHSIGRPHFAAFLVKQKIVKNNEQAFARYLGKGKPFYIPKTGLEFGRASELIRESGGIAVLAHPLSLYTAWGRLPDLIKKLKAEGLDGLEAWHPNAKVSACKRLENLARELGLRVTAGSDFHGEGRPGRKLGITSGGKKIDESFLDALPGIFPAA